MEGTVIVALAIGIPVVLFPAAWVWYLVIGGTFAAVKEARVRRAATTTR